MIFNFEYENVEYNAFVDNGVVLVEGIGTVSLRQNSRSSEGAIYESGNHVCGLQGFGVGRDGLNDICDRCD